MRYVVTKVGSWPVNHDASGKVVVRKLDRDQKEIVIAVAQWTDAGTTNRLQTDALVPSAEKWAQIDQAVRSALAGAANLPPDTRLDPGELPKGVETFTPGQAPKPEPKMTVLGTIGAVILIAVLGVAAYFVWPFLEKSGKANGEACKFDSDCRSDVCDFGRCAVGKRAKGDRCDMSSQCASGKCRLDLCD